MIYFSCSEAVSSLGILIVLPTVNKSFSYTLHLYPDRIVIFFLVMISSCLPFIELKCSKLKIMIHLNDVKLGELFLEIGWET